MQEPIFEEYGVEAADFWRENNALPEYYKETQGVRVNPDTIYLNNFINNAQPGGKFEGLNNEKLHSYGSKMHFYKGVPEIFSKTKKMVEEDPKYSEYNIKVEHYIVSTGMAEIIRGSSIMKDVEFVWGCELIEKEENGKKVIAEVGYTIDNTSKTRAIFEINKGVPKHPEIDVNAKMTAEMRRVSFKNMIYIADGPSDIPAFALVNKFGGSTFAIYPTGNKRAFDQVEELRRDGRINMYAEADYSEGTTAYMWISSRIMELAETIKKSEEEKLTAALGSVPKHLTD